MGETKITILCENRVSGLFGVTGEHGLAVLIEKNGEKILFDTGQGLSLRGNACALMVDLTAIKKIVLSHGHYDHTGGLAHVLFPPRGVEIIAHPDIFDAKYGEINLREEKKRYFIGIKLKKEFLESRLEAKFSFIKEYKEISSGIFFSGEVPRITDFELADSMLKVKIDDVIVNDPLLDDASLLIETDSGPVIITGCAHAGIVNIMNHFQEKSGHNKFHAVIGGLHLGAGFRLGGCKNRIEKSMDAFEKFGLNLIAVSHCTGNEVSAICYNRFKEKFAFANAGWSMTF